MFLKIILIKVMHLFLQKNDKIFAIGINHNGFFGFGNNKEIKNLTVKELSDKKSLISSIVHIM
jgi:hypothetical protein